MMSRDSIQTLLNKGFNRSVVNAIKSVVHKEGVSEEKAYGALCNIIVNIVVALKEEVAPYKCIDCSDAAVRQKYALLRQLILHRVVLGQLPNSPVSYSVLFRSVLRKFKEDPVLRACDIMGDFELDRALMRFNATIIELERMHTIKRDKDTVSRGTTYAHMVQRLADQIKGMQQYLPWLTACE
jgi:hypothetical protein